MQQIDCGKLAIHDGDERPIRQPPPHRQQQGTRPVGDGAIVPVVLLAPGLGWRQRRQDRQCPDAAGKWHLNQQHRADPAQAAAAHLAIRRGAHWVVEVAGRLDAATTAPFKCVINANDDRPRRHEDRDEQL
jgi:hypothetical protein